MRERLVLAGLAGQTLGHYKILQLIGGGGMSTVYKAYDLEEEKNVALKVLAPALAQQGSFSERFTREANIVVQLNHPHIVPVYDFGREKGYSYLVMPYLKAGSLAAYIQGGPLTLAWVAEVIDQLAKALEYAHQRGIIHRDLKPANILLDEDGRVMLSDFGVAHIQNAEISLTGSTLLGTPAYISPEQALSKKVEPRSDQYSLGVLLFQLTTGRLPFVSDSPASVLLQHINDPLPSPREINPAITEPIERVILKMTAKIPEHRFSSVAKMNSVFQMAVAHAFDPKAHPAPEIQLPASSGEPAPAKASPPPQRVGVIRRTGSAARLAMLLLAILSIGVVSAMTLQSQFSNTAEGPRSLSDVVAAELTTQAEIIEEMSTEIAQTISDKFDTDQVQIAVIQTLEAQDTTAATPTGASGLSPTSTQPLGPQPTANWTPTQPLGTVPVIPTPSTSLSTPPALPSPFLTPTIVLSPTATPTVVVVENVCSTASLTAFSVIDKKAIWLFTNSGSTDIEISETIIDWPSSNKRLRKVALGSDAIWEKKDDSSPTSLAADWEAGSREISSGGDEYFSFRFDVDAASSGYSLIVTLNDSCQIFAGG
ncbi:MAG: protein kinase [Chloroflexi bacterium]|nr:protein kinase [Chloroflexota bacterium]